jgi:hypothetical protein
VYVSYFGTNINATYGGYYSGFDTKPEIVTDKITVANSNCICNVKLKISTLSSYDTFQWYFNDNLIVGLLQMNIHQPNQAITKCKEVSLAAQIQYLFFRQNPVSSCPEDTDGTNNNIDIDLTTTEYLIRKS